MNLAQRVLEAAETLKRETARLDTIFERHPPALYRPEPLARPAPEPPRADEAGSVQSLTR